MGLGFAVYRDDIQGHEDCGRESMLCRVPSGRWGLYIIMMCTRGTAGARCCGAGVWVIVVKIRYR